MDERATGLMDAGLARRLEAAEADAAAECAMILRDRFGASTIEVLRVGGGDLAGDDLAEWAGGVEGDFACGDLMGFMFSIARRPMIDLVIRRTFVPRWTSIRVRAPLLVAAKRGTGTQAKHRDASRVYGMTWGG